MKSCNAICMGFLMLTACMCQVARAQDDEDFPPGLIGRYESAGEHIERIDPDINFDWGSAAPDSRLAAGPFRVRWSGRLLVRIPSPYRLHAYVGGQVVVRIDGREVLSGQLDRPGWISSPSLELNLGERELEVSYTRTDEPARIGLFWSCDEFPIEPVPAYLLFRSSPDDRLASVDRGRQFVESARCARCHDAQGSHEVPMAADLTFVASGLDREALIERIRNPRSANPSTRMPEFQWQPGEAESVAAYLWTRSRSVKLEQAGKISFDEDRRAGEVLFRSLGCMACHKVGPHGGHDMWSGPELTAVGSQRSVEWLLTWLKKPDALRPHQRMPQFDLRGNEQRQLAVYLSSLGVTDSRQRTAAKDAAAWSPDKQQVDRGRQLIIESRCAACHVIPGIEAPESLETARDWRTAKGCTGESRRHPRQPAFAGLDMAAVTAYFETHAKTESGLSHFEQGRRLLQSKGCLNCHERGTDKGLRGTAGQMAQVDSELLGQSEALLPPALDSVGDKLQTVALAKAIAEGNQPRRLPWLRVRMPKFRHAEAESAALVQYLVGHDRVPDAAPDAIRLHDVSSEDAQLSGYTLVSPRGLSCIACHALGDYEPRNVALGTRGSNLSGISSRMRPEFFLRWTRSPIRIVPGMEMPSYTKPVPGVLDGSIEKQLSAIWKAVNDPGFTVPTNPAVVEQFFVVRPGEHCRVVRDVFTVPDDSGGGGYVPRSLAVGFDNGHSILYDLDLGAIRQWTFGDMARQRTQGKSWYWDMAGIPLATGWSSDSEWALQDGQQLIEPTADEANRCRLESYEQDGAGLRLNYSVRFVRNGGVEWLRVRELWQPFAGADGQTGIRRSITCEGPPQTRAVFRMPSVRPGVGQPTAMAQAGGQSAGFGQQVQLPAAAGTLTVVMSAVLERTHVDYKPRPELEAETARVTSVPGYVGERLRLPASIMPTAITWDSQGKLVFTSLKGHVYRALDTDGDGLEDQLQLIEEGLAAPFGVIADGDSLIVAHKPELIRLRDTNGDGRADERTVVAAGWGYTDNYHDWTCGIVRDSQGYLYVGLGSDYAQPKRPRDRARWRGAVLRIRPGETVEPVGWSFRYPVGLAIRDDDVFVTDNQGVQNTFNEINHLRVGRHYGVPSRYEPDPEHEAERPSIQVPHPWTRSVNSLVFFQDAGSFAGQGIGCEYDSRYLIRYSLQPMGETYQGATYEFSDRTAGSVAENLVGPISSAMAANGDLYIGSIHDSGWLGGQNTGEIVRLRRHGDLPNGIRELRAHHAGFELDFIKPVQQETAAEPQRYSITGYTRHWGGSYATPDSDRHRVEVRAARVSADGRRVVLTTSGLKPGYVYEVSCDGELDQGGKLWPATGHYTMNVVPGPATPADR